MTNTLSDDIVKSLCHRADVGSGDCYLLRRGTNWIYHIPSHDAVMRITNEKSREDVEYNLHVIDNLSYVSPVLQPLSVEAVEYDGYVASLFPYADRQASLDKDAGDFGDALHKLHQSNYRPLLKRMDPLAPVEGRTKKMKKIGVKADIVTTIEKLHQECLTGYDEMIEQGNNVIHGDGHIGNAVIYKNELKLIDFDDIMIGSWHYDFIPALTSMKHMNNKQLFSQIIGDRMEELLSWRYINQAVAVREVTMISWLATLWGSPMVEKELERRIYSIVEKDNNVTWNAV